MSEKDPTDTKNLEACVRRHLAECGQRVRLEPIPTGKFNASYFVHSRAGDHVLRVAPPRDAGFVFYERDMMRQEPGIHRLLLERTTVPVAPIFAFDDSHEIVDRDFLIMERLPGKPMSESWFVNQDRVLKQVGEALARTHAQTAESYGYLGEHRPMAPQATWNEAFQIMWRKLIEDVAAAGHYDDEESASMIDLLEKHLPYFDREAPSSLLHMDVWGQNILVDEQSRLTGLVDWDRALWGDPEIEFAVLDYCGISQPAFWEGYGRKRDESKGGQIRQVFYLLYELQKYIVIRQSRQGDAAAARQYKRQVHAVLQRFFR